MKKIDEMEFIILDETGSVIGKVKGLTVLNLKGVELCKADSKTKLGDIVDVLLKDSMKYAV